MQKKRFNKHEYLIYSDFIKLYSEIIKTPKTNTQNKK